MSKDRVCFTDGYNTGLKVGYENGLDDLFKAFRKLYGSEEKYGYSLTDIRNIFDGVSYQNVIERFSPKEIIERFKAYEAEQERKKKEIEVGDVVRFDVEYPACTFVVTKISDRPDGKYAQGIVNHSFTEGIDLVGEMVVPGPVTSLVKTDKHIDISSLFDKEG